jgi:hypothetical protein
MSIMAVVLTSMTMATRMTTTIITTNGRRRTQAVTMIDSLDTLWVMGLLAEFGEARDWIRDHLTFQNVRSVSVFETTIRVLGGLLSAHDLSGDEVRYLPLMPRANHANFCVKAVPAVELAISQAIFHSKD